MDKLLTEKNAIARLAFLADCQRREDGRDLLQPIGMEDDIRDAIKASNWMHQFIDDEIDIPEELDTKLCSYVYLNEMFNSMRRWCKTNGISPMKNSQVFSKHVAKILNGKYNRETECDSYGRKKYKYEGIKLRDPLTGEESNGRY